MPSISLQQGFHQHRFIWEPWDPSQASSHRDHIAIHLHSQAPSLNDPSGLRPFTLGTNATLILLIDRSGTMSSQGKSHNPLAQMLQVLEQKREQEQRPWELYSFAETLQFHGQWAAFEQAPIASFVDAKGQTSLLSALDELLPKLQPKDELIILSDGEIDTRHRRSIEKSIQTFSQQQISITLLSPQLLALSKWQSFYDRRMLKKTWPPEKLSSQAIGSTFSTRLDTGVTVSWNHCIPSRGPRHLLPLLFGPQGIPLVYLNTRSPWPSYHIMAKPSDPKAIEQWLSRDRTSSPLVQLSTSKHQPNKTVIDLHIPKAQGQALQWLNQNGTKTIWPRAEDHYRLIPPERQELSFYHPKLGSFKIENLQHWHQYLRSNPSFQNENQENGTQVDKIQMDETQEKLSPWLKWSLPFSIFLSLALFASHLASTALQMKIRGMKDRKPLL